MSGARKHYGDVIAVARSDKEVRDLLRDRLTSAFVTLVEERQDRFRVDLLDLGEHMSIVGSVVYRDKTKKGVTEVIVFHVGPSL